jgi:hypothetical protein
MLFWFWILPENTLDGEMYRKRKKKMAGTP